MWTHGMKASLTMMAALMSLTFAEFTPLTTDFSDGRIPFDGSGAQLDNSEYVSAPSSMRVSHSSLPLAVPSPQ